MKDERKFKEVIGIIKGAEKDKDKFCKAARIERDKKQRVEFDSCDLMALCVFITIWLGMILFFIGAR